MLVLKLLLTPALISAATLVGRRYGPALSGWLVGFPFTSAPVSLFLALEQGTAFAAAAAVGSVASVMAQAAFALAYACARSLSWVAATAAGTVAFALVGLILRSIELPTTALMLVAAGVLVSVLRFIPFGTSAPRSSATAPRWDLPARAVVATVLVVALTALAPLLGPFASGVLSGFPVYATVLAVFAHRGVGAEAASQVMRGLVVGLFGFAAFFLAIALVLVPLGIGAAFALATLAVFSVQGASLVLLRRAQVRAT